MTPPPPQGPHNTPHLALPPSGSALRRAPPLSRQLVQVADCLADLADGRSLTAAFAGIAADERPGVQAITLHAVRRLAAAQSVLRQLAPRPPGRRVQALLWASLALLWKIDADETWPYTAHTLVDQAVNAGHSMKAPPGFINAVLRRWLREAAALEPALRADPAIRSNLPAWWRLQLQRDWPGDADAIMRMARLAAPMTLRVNHRHVDLATYHQRLIDAGHSAEAVGPVALRLERPCPVDELPGFRAGDVSVQDVSAQRAAELLCAAIRLPPGAEGLPPRRARVLDACAAPGGKTAHLLELADIDLLAIDIDRDRMQRVDDNLRRLGLHAKLVVADAARPKQWWDGQPFDAILLDAPCSGSGVVRRHPDIPWLRRPEDLKGLARQQDRLLDALWPLLAPGGTLLFATCSVFRVEGEQRIDAFLQRHPQALRDPAGRAPGHLLGLPENPSAGPATADGFFYALLQRPELKADAPPPPVENSQRPAA